MMNVTAVSAKFSMSTEEAIRLKFENKLDDIVKHNLAQSLASDIIANSLLDIQSNEHKPLLKYGKDKTIFSVTLFVHKQDLCNN